MQYALLIYEDDQVYGPDKSGPTFQEIRPKHVAFSTELGSNRVGGAPLKSSSVATTVRTAGGKQTIHDGPFAESKEQLGGFYIIDVPDLDAAIAAARKLPLYRDGAVEVRPVLEFGRG